MSRSPEYVLDASAILALVMQEPGAEAVLPLLPLAVISAVSYHAALSRLRQGGMPQKAVTAVLTRFLAAEPVPFDAEMAPAVYALQERYPGLSFSDAVTLAMAGSRKAQAVTAEAWERYETGVPIIRIGM